MDLALSTVLLFLVIVPGLVARFCYLTHPFSRKARSVDFLTEIFWSLIPGITIHFLYIVLVERLTGFSVSFQNVFYLIVGKEDKVKTDAVSANIHQNLLHIVGYYACLLALSALIGLALKWLVLWLKLDRKTEFFRFSNKWYYILSGGILDMDEYREEGSADIAFIGIDVLCAVGDRNIIYMGELFDYYLTSDGELDAILLRYPARRDLDEDGQKQGKYYDIPSDFLYVPYRNVINLNVNYFNFPVEPPVQATPESA